MSPSGGDGCVTPGFAIASGQRVPDRTDRPCCL